MGWLCTTSRSSFYPRSPCGERRCTSADHWRATNVSIHALLAESDVTLRAYSMPQSVFLSTLSLRRATGTGIILSRMDGVSIHALLAESDGPRPGKCSARPTFLSTLSLRRATRPADPSPLCTRRFYPRSPCGERRDKVLHKVIPIRFLSTLSLRRATDRAYFARKVKPCFYPRSPCGERPF